jgi:hypothetical protein
MPQETKKRHFHPSHTAYAGKQDKAMSDCHGEPHRTATPSEEKARCNKAFCRLMTNRKKTAFMSAVCQFGG